MKIQKLNTEEILGLYSKLLGWQLSQDKSSITKTFLFENFIEAFSWMTSISYMAEEISHHPEWKNVYNRVEVLLSTHDVKGLTKKDFFLAEFMDKKFKS